MRDAGGPTVTAIGSSASTINTFNLAAQNGAPMMLSDPNAPSLLDALRKRSHVDIDSLDDKSARQLAPFQDSTSNQAIAWAELSSKNQHDLLVDAARYAAQHIAGYPEVSMPQLAVEVAMVKLSLRMRPSINGRVHIQANPFYSHNIAETVACGIRYLALASNMDTSFRAEHLSVKIASTWEGLMACKQLQEIGIATLATVLYSEHQAVLAAEVGCTYIAPYVNDLRVHFEPKYKDPSPAFHLVARIQDYYQQHGYKTRVLAASLTSIEEAMMLAGVHHITIPPKLLRQLGMTRDGDICVQSVFPEGPEQGNRSEKQLAGRKLTYIDDEAGFRLAMKCDDGGKQQQKLTEAINIFCERQTMLEQLVKPLIDEQNNQNAQPGAQKTVT